MKVLVINAGSSSLKYQLIEMDTEQLIAKGLCERIGVDGAITHTVEGGARIEKQVPFPTHKEAFMEVIKVMTEGEGKVIDSMADIKAIGHRVLHGSEIYKQSTLVDDKVIDTIMALRDLGPLHNPPQAVAMRACREVFGKDTPMVAVFDTSFHQTMPPKAYIFPVPYEYYEKYSIRRYGFHGTSHRYVSLRYFEFTGSSAEGSRIVTCHLGNGSSIAAIKDGRVVDTTMGLTPLDGLIMGTRAGGIDPSVVTYIAQKEGFTPEQMSDLLNKKSGLLGISGISSDNRDVRAAAQAGNPRAILACSLLTYQIKKYIGSYAAAMGGLDAVIFTGGIGENDHLVRAEALEGLEFLGISVDPQLNQQASRREAVFSTPDSRVLAMVLPTNEEIMIARDTLELVNSL